MRVDLVELGARGSHELVESSVQIVALLPPSCRAKREIERVWGTARGDTVACGMTRKVWCGQGRGGGEGGGVVPTANVTGGLF